MITARSFTVILLLITGAAHTHSDRALKGLWLQAARSTKYRRCEGPYWVKNGFPCALMVISTAIVIYITV
jgi:hypothetical protein